MPELKDAALVTTGISRWHNYYVEGLDWLVRNVGIDGLYLDDIAFDRKTMKRVRKVLDAAAPRRADRPALRQPVQPARRLRVNSANLYMEHFPYIDRLWFGEYFDYRRAARLLAGRDLGASRSA